MAESRLETRVESIRHFNRFYTQKIGVLQEGLLKSSFSLTQLRVLYELTYRERPSAAELCQDLNLDPGYLSRILGDFENRGLIERKPSKEDARQNIVELTRKGRDAFAPLNTRSHEEIAALLSPLSSAEQAKLIDAMRMIEILLNAKDEHRSPYILRTHQPGDMGWVVHRHGVLYSQEYGWDERFEALVASICAKFIQRFDPKKERCWIAEKDGEIVGSVFLVKRSKYVGQLRMLYVEPSARGSGIGGRLVSECVRFGKQVGYKKIVLWTNSILHSARKIYEAQGFKMTHKESEHSFGHDMIFETWELKL
jgi:DNA-binding MarR family transcriptional regulator/N-acetylglutamate synthase-like GNAT family acetyltransferase